MKYLFPFFTVFLIACAPQEEEQLSDQEKVDRAVRSYFFLDDSVKVKSEITDTIFVTELDEMLETVENNIDLVNQDIDTLRKMIDDRAYNIVEQDAEGVDKREEVNNDPAYLKYNLKLEQLVATELSFQQSKRIMLHLRRSQVEDVAGYEISTSYEYDGETLDFELLMNANYYILD